MTEAQLSNLSALARRLHRYPSAKIRPYMSQLEEAIAELMDANLIKPACRVPTTLPGVGLERKNERPTG